MGLAYDLDTKKFPNPHFFAWDQVLTLGDTNLFNAGGDNFESTKEKGIAVRLEFSKVMEAMRDTRRESFEEKDYKWSGSQD